MLLEYKFEKRSVLYFIALCLSFGGNIALEADLWAHDGQEPIYQSIRLPGLVIDQGKSGITVKAEQVQLKVLVETLERTSKIHFRLPDHLKNNIVTETVSRSNWAEIIQDVLKNYDTVDFWESENILSRVWIMEGKGLEQSAPQSEAKRLMKNYQLLIRIPPGMKMPIRIYENPDIRPFLQMQGIKNPADWENVHLAGVARRQAERNLNALLYVERQKLNNLEKRMRNTE